jgi:hypothetical protein
VAHVIAVLYKVTEAGLDPVTCWANEAPVDPPTLPSRLCAPRAGAFEHQDVGTGSGSFDRRDDEVGLVVPRADQRRRDGVDISGFDSGAALMGSA